VVDSSDSSVVSEHIDEGVVRAGAAAAARRRELGISQRSLAADGVITAAALIAFEKGRSWPRAGTRAKLETVLQWPAGSIERLRHGAQPLSDVRADIPVGLPPAESSNGEFALVLEALDAAAHSLRSVVAALPSLDDPSFTPQVTLVLADLRQLEAVASRAARLGAMTPALVKTLAGMRRQYDDVMQLASTAPNATLGQRFYTARRRASLSIAEAAQIAEVGEDVVALVESEGAVTSADAAALESAIEALSWD
jgi:transcriptional regulator with XRE-family HTH domain